RKLLKMLVEIVSQIVFNIARHVYQQPPLREEKNALRQRYGDDQPGVLQELRVGDLRRQVIDRVAQNYGGGQPHDVSHEHAYRPDHNRFLVAREVAQKSAKRSHRSLADHKKLAGPSAPAIVIVAVDVPSWKQATRRPGTRGMIKNGT